MGTEEIAKSTVTEFLQINVRYQTRDAGSPESPSQDKHQKTYSYSCHFKLLKIRNKQEVVQEARVKDALTSRGTGAQSHARQEGGRVVCIRDCRAAGPGKSLELYGCIACSRAGAGSLFSARTHLHVYNFICGP